MVNAIVDWLRETRKWLLADDAVQIGSYSGLALNDAFWRHIHLPNHQDQNIPARAFDFDIIRTFQ